MVIAAHWYASGTFWAAAGFVAVVLFGALTVLVTYVVGTPRRQLTYCIISDVSLLAWAPDTAREIVQVRFRDQPVQFPRVLSVNLTARGRRDIRSSDFDQGKPLALDVGVRIVGVLAKKELPGGFTGSTFQIGPTLIRKRQSSNFTFLVDGEGGKLTCVSPLIDVVVREQVPSEMARRVAAYNGLIISWITGSNITLTVLGGFGILKPRLSLGAIIAFSFMSVAYVILSRFLWGRSFSHQRRKGR